MKKVWIIRHGQTDYNKKNIIQGAGIDASLNETGRLQGEAFYAKYKDIPFDFFVTSALVRTQETISKFIVNKDYTKMTALNEISWGIYDGTQNTGGKDSIFSKMVNDWHEGKTHLKPEKGESPEDVALRQQEFINLIKKEEFSHALVCMHGRAMRILLSQLLKFPLKEMDKFKHHNTGLYCLNLTDGEFVLEKENDLTHLKEFKTENQLIF